MVSTLFRGFELSYKYLKLIYMIGYLFLPFAYSFPNIGKHLVFPPMAVCVFLFYVQLSIICLNITKMLKKRMIRK